MQQSWPSRMNSSVLPSGDQRTIGLVAAFGERELHRRAAADGWRHRWKTEAVGFPVGVR